MFWTPRLNMPVLTRAADLLLAGIDRVLAALKARAFEHKDTVPASAAAMASTPNPPRWA